MTKKDYIILANAIRMHHEEHCKGEWKENMQEFVDWTLAGILQANNPNFNKLKFRDACGF